MSYQFVHCSSSALSTFKLAVQNQIRNSQFEIRNCFATDGCRCLLSPAGPGPLRAIAVFKAGDAHRPQSPSPRSPQFWGVRGAGGRGELVLLDVHPAHPIALTLELFHQACPELAEGCPPMKPPAPQTRALFIRFDPLYTASLLSASLPAHPSLCGGAEVRRCRGAMGTDHPHNSFRCLTIPTCAEEPRCGGAGGQKEAMTCTTRSAAFPSHSSGTFPPLPLPSSTTSASATIHCGSEPTTVFVPWVTVTGRSVFSRNCAEVQGRGGAFCAEGLGCGGAEEPCSLAPLPRCSRVPRPPRSSAPLLPCSLAPLLPCSGRGGHRRRGRLSQLLLPHRAHHKTYHQPAKRSAMSERPLRISIAATSARISSI